ncbi:hypothetical protein Tco_0363385 [Tanacetum coccineum]
MLYYEVLLLLNDKGPKMKEKAPMIIEETPKKSKEQILQEEASLAEAIRLDSLQKEEEAKQIHLDSLLAQRIVEEEELNEAKIKANAELSKHAKSQGRILYKLVKRVESFAPINFKATKASLKRFGEELQTKTLKRLKDDEAKDDEPTKKSRKRRKQIARRGLHTNVDKDDSEGSDEVSEQDDSVIVRRLYQIRILLSLYTDCNAIDMDGWTRGRAERKVVNNAGTRFFRNNGNGIEPTGPKCYKCQMLLAKKDESGILVDPEEYNLMAEVAAGEEEDDL